MLKSLMTNNKLPVLIVAKCIVNVTLCCECPVVLLVLIVAKCIVNVTVRVDQKLILEY